MLDETFLTRRFEAIGDEWLAVVDQRKLGGGAAHVKGEQAAAGIRLNCLRPGATMTEMNVRWMEEHPDWLDGVLAKIPMRRAAEVDEIARAALWLLSDEASYVTGAILDASGGWVAP